MRRRTSLGKLSILAVAVLVGVAVASPAIAQGAGVHVKVMTRNMDAGTDLNYVAGVTDETAFIIGLMQTIAEVDASHVPERAARLAAEIAQNSPDLVALQEVTTWQFNDAYGARRYDQLALLQATLEAAGAHYRVAAVQTLTDIPIEIPGVLSARFIDHNAILVRSDVPPGQLEVRDVVSGVYQYGLSFDSPLGPIEVPNGWMLAEVVVRGARFRFVNTHLLSPAPGPFFGVTEQLQMAQAAELLQMLADSPARTILAGDFNSDAEQAGIGPDQTGTAAMIASAGFIDAWHLLRPWQHGFTWALFPEDGLSSTLSERIDLVYSVGAIPFMVYRTGMIPDGSGVYASDHAGVVVTYLLGKQ